MAQGVFYNAVTSVPIALGGNLPSDAGSPSATVRAALDRLDGAQDGGLRLERCSRFFRTPCFPAGAGPDYVNAVAMLTVAGPAVHLLETLHMIEAQFGRERVQRWGRRTLDLDLLAFGDAVLPDLTTYSYWRDLSAQAQLRATPDRLVLPHPRMQDRAFVLVPLADVAPDWRHPVTGETVATMLARLDPADIAAIRSL